MSKRDYYDVLGLTKRASAEDLKKAYRKKAMKYHPDRNPDDPEASQKFKEATEAYDILSDSSRRNSYDQFGHQGVDPSSFGSGRSSQDGFGDIFGDIFGDVFGGASRSQRSNRGSDLQYSITISLEDAVRGTSENIRIPTLHVCDVCHGTASEPGTSPIRCSDCDGAGQIRMQQGFFSVSQTCRRCGGSGQMISSPCKSCDGQGRKHKSKTLSVKIPSGVDTGDRVRLAGEGEAGEKGGPSGDLYVEFKVTPHDVFERDGKHLYCEAPISFIQATLGGEIEVPTLNNKVKIKIPEGTQTGKLFRLKGKGVKPVRGGSIGDLLCRVVIETPQKLTKQQRKILKDLESSFKKDYHHNPLSHEWLVKVKSFFESNN